MSDATKGQSNRDNVIDKMIKTIKQLVPTDDYEALRFFTARFTNLAPDTVEYSYFRMFKKTGELYRGLDGNWNWRDLNPDSFKKPKTKQQYEQYYDDCKKKGIKPLPFEEWTKE